MSDYMYDENNKSVDNNPENVGKNVNVSAYTESQSQSTAQAYAIPERKRKGLSAGLAAVLCVVCILLSCGAGFAGAYIYSRSLASTNVGGTSLSQNGTLIVHKEVREETSTYDPSVQLPIASVVTKVEDSVVEIATEYRNVSVFYQYVTSGAGSGVIISEDGYIITNNHVISDSENSNKVADSIVVRLKSGEKLNAVVIGRDEDSDIALLKVDAKGLTYATLGDSSTLVVGEEVIAVGNPLGELGGTVTNGIISALDREISVDGTVMNLLQTNAAVNPGNSGGGLFNMQGQLVGIVNAKSSGTGVEGIGFAIPINDAYNTVKQLMEHGYVQGKAVLGVTFRVFTNSASAYYYFGTGAVGVYVIELSEGYNDDVLKVGDRVVVFDGKEVTANEDIKTALSGHSVGDSINVTVIRDGKAVDLTVKCYEKVPTGINFEESGN